MAKSGDLCENCGQVYGGHSNIGDECPDGQSTFQPYEGSRRQIADLIKRVEKLESDVSLMKGVTSPCQPN